MRQHPVRDRDRLRALHVRVGRHERLLMVGRLPYHHVLKAAHGGIELVTGIDPPETCRGRHLVVAAPAGVELRRDVADLRVQQPVDHRVYVFVGRERRCTSGEALRDRVEAGLDPATLVECEYAGIPQCHGPGFRQANVEWPQPKVGANRPVEASSAGAGAAGEAPAPQLMVWSNLTSALPAGRRPRRRGRRRARRHTASLASRPQLRVSDCGVIHAPMSAGSDAPSVGDASARRPSPDP